MFQTEMCPFKSSNSEKSIQYINHSLSTKGKRKFLFLDRDGVINHDPDCYVKNLHEFEILGGIIEAIRKAYEAGWIINICTNQPGVTKNLMSHSDLDEIHEYLRSQVENAEGCIAEIYYCPHQHGTGCWYRKPEPGLLFAIAQQFNMSEQEIQNSWFVGDHIRDLRAGKNFGCKTALVKTGHGSTFIKANTVPEYASVFENLLNFVDFLIQQDV